MVPCAVLPLLLLLPPPLLLLLLPLLLLQDFLREPLKPTVVKMKEAMRVVGLKVRRRVWERVRVNCLCSVT